MLSPQRASLIAILMVLHVPQATSAISELITLLKTTDEEVNCDVIVTSSQRIAIRAHPKLTTSSCGVIVEVPENEMAFLEASERTCAVSMVGNILHWTSWFTFQATASENISQICNKPRREMQLTSGKHFIHFSAMESVELAVNYYKIQRTTCQYFHKDLKEATESVFILENSQPYAPKTPCVLELPPALTIEVLGFVPTTKRKCCPMVSIASTTNEISTVEMTDDVSVCEANSTAITLETRCERSYLYFKRASEGDSLIFRVASKPTEAMQDCEKGYIPPRESLRKPKCYGRATQEES